MKQYKKSYSQPPGLINSDYFAMFHGGTLFSLRWRRCLFWQFPNFDNSFPAGRGIGGVSWVKSVSLFAFRYFGLIFKIFFNWYITVLIKKNYFSTFTQLSPQSFVFGIRVRFENNNCNYFTACAHLLKFVLVACCAILEHVARRAWCAPGVARGKMNAFLHPSHRRGMLCCVPPFCGRMQNFRIFYFLASFREKKGCFPWWHLFFCSVLCMFCMNKLMPRVSFVPFAFELARTMGIKTI